MGSGPPLVLLPGLAPDNRRPVGIMRAAELQTMGSFARAFTVYWVGRPMGLPRATTFSQLAAVMADALATEFDDPVNFLGISTGGSLAQQLAAEHPERVRRLVLMSTGCRLGPDGAAMQRDILRLAEAGRPRPLMAAVGRQLVPPWRGRTLAAVALYVAGPSLYPGVRDPHDLAVTVEAEDGFDLRTLPTITAPTLVISGADDRFYAREIIEETARLIPGARLSIYADRGHITVVSDRRATREVCAFLA